MAGKKKRGSDRSKEKELERQDPKEIAKSFALQVFQSVEKRTLKSVSKELRDAGQRIIADAEQWGRTDDSDLEKLPETMIDISLAQFELWLVGQQLRGIHAKAVRNTLFLNYTKLGLSQDTIASLTLVSMGRIYASRNPFFKGKVAAVLDILGELTGIPFDLIEEFLGKDINRLVQALQELAEARKKGKDSPEYKRAMRRLMAMLKKIWEKLTSRRFREWLIRKVGKEVAEKLLEKMAAMIIPLLGWIYFAILFVGLLFMWWDVILDP